MKPEGRAAVLWCGRDAVAVVLRCARASLQSAAAKVLFSSLNVSLISNSDSMILHDFIFTCFFFFFLK